LSRRTFFFSVLIDEDPETRNLLRSFFSGFILFTECTEGSTAITCPFSAGLGMDGDDRPRELDVQVRFEVIREIMGVLNRCGAGHHQVKFNKDIRTRASGSQVVEPGIIARVFADDRFYPVLIHGRNTMIDKIRE
jgi:hypothetical protein